MKIVMLCDFYQESLAYQEQLCAKFYVKHGHAVTVVTSTHESVFDYMADRHDDRRPARTYEHAGVKIVRLPYRYNILHRLKAFEPLDELLEAERPDLIFLHDIMLNIPDCVRYLERHPNARMIMDYHADYSNSGKNLLSRKVLHGVCRKWFLDRARPHLSRIFPVVPSSATFLREIYKVRPSEMELLPLGADTEAAAAVRKSGAREQVRAHLGIGVGDIAIFTGGKLTPAKKTDVLIAAAALLQAPGLHIIVVGQPGDDHAAYGAELTRLAANTARVHMVGWLEQDALYRHLAAADMAVFPASQSVLWQQAIAMGLPMIVGDTGHQDISYLNVERNIVILRGEEIRADRLASTIADLMADPDRMRAMREGAFRVADEQLNWDRLVERTLRFNVPSPIPGQPASATGLGPSRSRLS
jgi:glycosyltransferase involved in cell wall biosynthesis